MVDGWLEEKEIWKSGESCILRVTREGQGEVCDPVDISSGLRRFYKWKHFLKVKKLN